MQSLALVVLFCVLIETQTVWVQTLTSEEKSCVQTLNLNENDITTKYLTNRAKESSVELNNFLHCLWKAQGYQNEHGDINYEKLMWFSPLEMIRIVGNPELAGTADFADRATTTAVEICHRNPPGGSQGDSAGEKTRLLLRCLMENFEKNIKKFLSQWHG